MFEEALEFLRSRQKVTLFLTVANVAVFIVLSILGSTTDSMFMLRCGACYTPFVQNGEYWRLLTSVFLHFGLPHLLYNMVCLLALGNMLEEFTGHVRFAAIYLISGIAGNLLTCFVELRRGGGFAVSAGASGAIFGGIGALFWLVLSDRYVSGRVSAQRMILLVVLMVAQGFLEAGTNNIAHVGGLAAGFIVAFLLFPPWKKQTESRRGGFY